jgi:DNA polymerase III delta subunit
MQKNLWDININSANDKCVLFYGSNQDAMEYALSFIIWQNNNQSCISLNTQINKIKPSFAVYAESEFILNYEDKVATSLFDEDKIIVIKDVSDKNCEIYQKIANYENCTFYFFSEKLRAASKIVKWTSEHKQFVSVKAYDISDFAKVRMLSQIAKNMLINISKEAINLIIQQIAMQDWISSMIKLTFFEKEIDKECIMSLLPKDDIEEFDICYGISSGDKNSLSYINDENNDIGLIRLVFNHFANLMFARQELNLGGDLMAITKKLGIFFKKEQIFIQNVQNIQIDSLCDILDTIVMAEIAFKQGQLNAVKSMFLEIIKILEEHN